MDVKGVPVRASYTVSRKLSDGSYGSYESVAMLEVDLAKDADLDDVFASLSAYLTVVVASDVNAKRNELASTQLEPEKPAVESLASEAKTPPPPPTESPPSPPDAPPASAPAETHEILDNCSISHQVTGSGIHHLLVKGGKYTKYGIFFWPEKASEFIKSQWQEWPIGKSYGLPDGFTEAVIQMKPDGKPDRVVGLR